jgi:carbamoyl-phosphate synthase large subunit
MLEVAKMFVELDFKIKATEGTHRFLAQNGIESELIKKLHEGRPNIADAIMNKEIQLVVNTPIGKQSQHDDSYIRKTAIKCKVPYITTLTAALASVKGIKAYRETHLTEDKVKSLQQDYHQE